MMPSAHETASVLAVAALLLAGMQVAWVGATGQGAPPSTSQGQAGIGVATPMGPPGWDPVISPAEPAGPPASTAPLASPRFASVPLKLGLDLTGMRATEALGQKPDYVMLWAGAWNWKGWDDLRRELAEARDANVTPVVQWYFWGEDISPAAVEHGVWSGLHGAWKTKPWWDYLASQLGVNLHQVMQGREVLVVLESEFNKHGIDTDEAFDADLAAQASLIRTRAPEAKLVLGFGNWGRSHWANFDRAAAASDYIGFQTLRASTRDPDSYQGAADDADAAASYIQRAFGKPSLLMDLALSSFGDREQDQARVLENLLARSATLRAEGLQGLVYRAWRDAPDSPLLWFGEAERHWGLVDAQGPAKPARDVWLAAMAARAS
jgi:hypothetical protein